MRGDKKGSSQRGIYRSEREPANKQLPHFVPIRRSIHAPEKHFARRRNAVTFRAANVRLGNALDSTRGASFR